MKESPRPSLKGPILTVLVIVALGAIVYGGIRYISWRTERNYAKNLLSLGPGTPGPSSVEELTQAIATLEGKLDEQVEVGSLAGHYWKLLSSRYMEKKMYGKALEALERARSYSPEDPTLFYLTGISAASMAKASLDVTGAEKKRLFALAESAHLRAIALDATYMRPRYALSVLYVFELDRPRDAIAHLELFVHAEKKDMDGYFLLARAYYALGKLQMAADCYDQILSLSKDGRQRAEAEQNKKAVLDALYK